MDEPASSRGRIGAAIFKLESTRGEPDTGVVERQAAKPAWEGPHTLQSSGSDAAGAGCTQHDKSGCVSRTNGPVFRVALYVLLKVNVTLIPF